MHLTAASDPIPTPKFLSFVSLNSRRGSITKRKPGPQNKWKVIGDYILSQKPYEMPIRERYAKKATEIYQNKLKNKQKRKKEQKKKSKTKNSFRDFMVPTKQSSRKCSYIPKKIKEEKKIDLFKPLRNKRKINHKKCFKVQWNSTLFFSPREIERGRPIIFQNYTQGMEESIQTQKTKRRYRKGSLSRKETSKIFDRIVNKDIPGTSRSKRSSLQGLYSIRGSFMNKTIC
ncbi:unnamed protein product [Moneuplotes crassus]|uniref:Uncharacterized protein n=1 Tax=Euplotes crassus TaxID=5936 RepID=A0AAD2D055_EUPCR|nr:unnamed protein product [Moneuplotes crassus]